MNAHVNSLIKNHQCTGIDSIVFGNGRMVLLSIHFFEGGSRLSPICDSTLESFLHYNTDCLSTFDVFATCENEHYNVFCGDGSSEGSGNVHITDKAGKLLWFCYFENSEPFTQVEIKDRCVYALSEANITWKIPIDSPLDIELIR